MDLKGGRAQRCGEIERAGFQLGGRGDEHARRGEALELSGKEGCRRGGARQIELPFRHHQREVEQVEIVDPRVGLAGPVLPTAVACDAQFHRLRSEEHTSELQSLMRNSYTVFCLKNKTQYQQIKRQNKSTPR